MKVLVLGRKEEWNEKGLGKEKRELRMTIGYVVFLLPISWVAGLCRQSLPTVVYTKEY
jgi:hypothetical protein